MTTKRQLLCPIGSICRLILLNFRPDGTKIGINNHAIEIDKPEYIQGFVRWVKHDSRNDMCALYSMIVRFIDLYLLKSNNDDNEQEDDVIDPYIKKLTEWLCSALNKLQVTYHFDNGVLTNQFYILLLRSAVNGIYTPDMLPSHLQNEKNTFLNQEKIKELWTNEKIINIHDLYIKLFDARSKNDHVFAEAISKAIVKMLDRNDEQFRLIVNAINQ